MFSAGWQPLPSSKHTKFERILPVSGRRQVVTLPTTPSDCVRGVRNTAGVWVRLGVRARACERGRAGKQHYCVTIDQFRLSIH